MEVIIYEPILQGHGTYMGCNILGDFADFKKQSDLILANRYDEELNDVKTKVYSRDLFGEN